MKRIIISAIALLMLFGSTAQAQNPQRRELLQGLLQGLIESQIEQAKQPRQNQPYRTAPGQRAPYAQPGRSGNPGRTAKIEVSPKMVAARRTLNQWSKASGNLVIELQRHEQASPQLRPLLADSMRFQAAVGGLCRRAELSPTIGPLKNDFAALDRDWRIINIRLQAARGLPAACQGYITTINDLGQQLCDSFQIEPQVNRRELGRLAVTMNNDFDHLLRGLYYNRSPKGKQLLPQGQKLQANIGQAAALVSHGSYSELVSVYKACFKDWRKFSRRVLALRDERLKYSIQHIEDNGRLIQEQLFLPVELDRGYLAAITADLTIDSNQLFQKITMADLLAQKNPQMILNRGRAFTQACIKLNQEIESNAPEDQLAWSYLAFAKSWDAVQGNLRECKNPAVDRRLDNITLTMNSLGEVLGSHATLSHGELVHLFEELDGLCRQAAFDAHQYIDQTRYTPVFQQQICGGFDELQRQVYAVHRESLQPTYKVKPQTLKPIFQQWETLKPMVNQCKGADKTRFINYRQSLEPMLVKLQILYGS